MCILAQQHVILHALQSVGLPYKQTEAITPRATHVGLARQKKRRGPSTTDPTPQACDARREGQR
jgi:hypothetical protein